MIPEISQENILGGVDGDEGEEHKGGGRRVEGGGVGGTADEIYGEEEEAIYEDLYNDIMPLPAPFNLVEYEVSFANKSTLLPSPHHRRHLISNIYYFNCISFLEKP